MTTLTTQAAQEASYVHWQVDELHHGLKQLTGAEKCQCRKRRSQRNHIACCYHAWLSLKVKTKSLGKTLYQTLKNEKRFVLIGHSMGTLLSIAYAARYPEQVERLVLLSIPFFGDAKKARRFFNSRPVPYSWFFSNMVLAAVICTITRRVFGRLVLYFRRDLPREVAADIVKHSWRSFTSSFWEVVCNYDSKKDADALGDLPVLRIHGDQEDNAPFTGTLELAEGRQNWQTQVLPGVDHPLRYVRRQLHPHSSQVAERFMANSLALYQPGKTVSHNKARIL